MPYIYSTLLLLGTALVLFNKRMFDMFDLAFIGLAAFTMPLCFGAYYSPPFYEYTEIALATYPVILLPVIALLLVMLYRNTSGRKAIVAVSYLRIPRMFKDRLRDKIFLWLLSLTICIVTGINVERTIMLDQILGKKAMSGLSVPGTYFFLNATCSFTLVWSLQSRNYLVSLLPISAAMIMAGPFQSRASLLFCIVVFLLHTAFRKSECPFSPRSKLIALPVAAMAFTALSVYDKVKGKLLLAHWTEVKYLLTNPTFYGKLLTHFEANSAVFFLDGTVKAGLTGPTNYLALSIAGVVPFFKNITGISYPKWAILAQNEIMGGFPHGFASFMWAELFSYCGLSAVLAYVCLWIAGIAFLQRMACCENNRFLYSLAISLATQWCVFFMRVTLDSHLSYIVNHAVFLSLLFLLAKLLSQFLRQSVDGSKT